MNIYILLKIKDLSLIGGVILYILLKIKALFILFKDLSYFIIGVIFLEYEIGNYEEEALRAEKKGGGFEYSFYHLSSSN